MSLLTTNNLNGKKLATPKKGKITKNRTVVQNKAVTNAKKNSLFPNTQCLVDYYPKLFTQSESQTWFSTILANVQWKEEEATIFGKKITVPRKMAYFGNFSYYYSGSSKEGEGWPEWIVPLKSAVEEFTGTTFNYALMNFYKDGKSYIGYHADDEKDLVEGSIIASVSFGAERDFLFKRRYAKTFSGRQEPVTKISLASGSLLTMGGTTQSEYKHALPKRAKCTSPRINITFRNVVEQ